MVMTVTTIAMSVNPLQPRKDFLTLLDVHHMGTIPLATSYVRISGLTIHPPVFKQVCKHQLESFFHFITSCNFQTLCKALASTKVILHQAYTLLQHHTRGLPLTSQSVSALRLHNPCWSFQVYSKHKSRPAAMSPWILLLEPTLRDHVGFLPSPCFMPYQLTLEFLGC